MLGSSILMLSWLKERGFGDAQFLDVRGSQQLLISSHLRERDEMLLWSILCGGVWNGFSWVKLNDGMTLSVASVGSGIEMVIYFGTVPFHPVVHEFLPLEARDRGKWPRCLLWHGWLTGLGLGECAPWFISLGRLGDRSSESVLGCYPLDCSRFSTPPPDFWDAENLAIEIGDYPCVWTDGGIEPCPSASVTGAGVDLLAPELFGRR